MIPARYRRYRSLVFRNSVCNVDRRARKLGITPSIDLACARILWEIATARARMQETIDRTYRTEFPR